MSRSPWKRLLAYCLLIVPWTLASVWTCYPAGLALWALASTPAVTLSADGWQDSSRVLEVRRQIQKHFLDYYVYLPLEDIVAAPTGESSGGSSDQSALLMQKVCGKGRLFVWVPFKFKLPIAGEKVFEWCWKPQSKDV